MHRIFTALLFLSLILSACSPRPLSPELSSPTPPLLAATEEIPPPTKLVATLSTPNVGQEPTISQCGYQWAYQDLPELSAEFQKSVQRLQPEAQAEAYVFGENCILADGSTGEFLAMQTDFRIMLPVSDLADPSDLGGWIVEVAQIVEQIPSDQIAGPKPGNIMLIFQAGDEQRVVNFELEQYQALPDGLNNAEVFEALQ